MLKKIAPTDAASQSQILSAADSAARRIPPAFPLEATVAVNPFLGQTGEDLATAAARLARVGGVSALPSRQTFTAKLAAGEIDDGDLAAALSVCPHAARPADLGALKAATAQQSASPMALPTLAHLAAEATGTDWPGVIERTVGLWAVGQFDMGQALWTPAPGHGAYAAWRNWAVHDLTPELAGLTGFAAHAAASPLQAEDAILRATNRLGLTVEAAETAFHRLLIELGGWAQHARWMLWQAELAGASDSTIIELLAIRLVWEEALLEHAEPQIAATWQQTVAAHAEPVSPSADQVIDGILQEAAERAHQRGLSLRLPGDLPAVSERPVLQAAFCIDVRSEVFRRALESTDAGVETIGFAGFFGLPVAHTAQASVLEENHLPVLLTPGVTSHSAAPGDAEERAHISARATRAWGRFRQAAVSSFAFVEAAGPLYAGKLVRDALGLGAPSGPRPAPHFDPALSVEQKVATAASVLRAMSMAKGHARLVLLLGHGAQVTNNPQESAYHCGACGGFTGEVSARLLADLLNDPEVRAELPGQALDLPEDTLFVAGLHDTTTDRITLYSDGCPVSHATDLAQARVWLDQAGGLARAERAVRLPRATAASIAARATDWAEVRPEWGLAGCAAFIAAPRGATHKADLGGRAFLHSYDWRADEGFSTLELILTAPVVVASWISLQYYGSVVVPELFGGGNKLLHNVTGGIGVVEGNGGRLRAGLPWQAIHDGEHVAHEPLRLSVLVEAPQEAIADVLSRHDGLRELFDNGWLHLLALEDGQIAARYRPGLVWEDQRPAQRGAAA
ncbi:MAG: DUF2309 domain-containing protein [Rhodobacteraceae bacterium]|nr:DUF2309 domain-containing protein [Paracoccaceae bacterium]